MGTSEQNQEARQLLRDTENEFKKNGGEYWQGRKDGSRLMYALFQDAGLRQSMEDVVESSLGSRKFDYEVLDEFIEDCVYNIAAIVYELDYEGKPHPRTKLNLRRLVEQYDFLSKQGKVPAINDHCLSRDE